ncbi:putative SEC-C motif-containing protein [Gammaproteobacteria bacterium]
MNKYSSALKALLHLGNMPPDSAMKRYAQLSIGPEHIPELIIMATDEDLLWGDGGSAEVYAPGHACQMLLQLRASEALEPLMLALFPLADDDDSGNSEWLFEEVTTLFAELANKATLEQLKAYYVHQHDYPFRQEVCIECLQQIATTQPDLRQGCINILVAQLERYAHSDPEINASLANALCEIKAQETMPLIRRAYAADSIDPSLMGEVEQAEYYMGLRDTLPEMQGGWWYLPTQESQLATVGRNDPCPCGSGKKYKKCCLDKDTTLEA